MAAERMRGGLIGGRHCPKGIDGQPSMRFTNPANGEVYTHSTVRAPEENVEIRAQVGSMTMTSIASTSMSALLQLPAPPRSSRTASQFKDGDLMAMITSALKLGVQSMREFAKAHSVTHSSLQHWVKLNGRPGWKRLQELHGPTVTPTAPKNTAKKGKAVVKTGEEHTEKKKQSGTQS
jgi:hypothetical protein